MRFIRSFRLWIGSLFKRSQMEADLNDELRDYLEHQAEQYVANGMPPERGAACGATRIGWSRTNEGNMP